MYTREKLQQLKRVRYDVVELPELGDSMRIASLSARGIFALKEVQGDSDKIVIKRDLALVLLRDACVDGVGRSLFPNEAAVDEFIGTISIDTLTDLINAIVKLTNGTDKVVKAPVVEGEVVAGGNSEASQNAA